MRAMLKGHSIRKVGNADVEEEVTLNGHSIMKVEEAGLSVYHSHSPRLSILLPSPHTLRTKSTYICTVSLPARSHLKQLE